MAGLTRRRFVLLSAVALLGAACGSPAVEAGIRGSGTTLRPRETDLYATPESAALTSVERAPVTVPTSLPTRVAQPTPVPTSTVAQDPIVPTDVLPTRPGGETEEQMHVVPLLAGKPVIAPLPARRIVIPTIGVDSKVIQLGTKLDRKGQVAWETAPFSVGQHKGLAGPGQNGNMILSGHISSPAEGAIFHRLPDLKVGEGVVVATDERQFLYQVFDVKTVTPDQISVLDQTPDSTATLITCVPDGIYSHRLVVSLRLV